MIDTLQLLRVLVPQGPLVDVGSGAGVPAVPIKILYPDVEMHLIVPTPDIPRIQKLITEQTGGAAKGEILEEITYEEAVD